MKNLKYLYDDGETVFFTDGNLNYGLNYFYIPKEELREFVNPDSLPYTVEQDEDGFPEYYYDDDSWDVDGDIIHGYIMNYLSKGGEIIIDGSDASEGEIFIVNENDNGWYETLMENINS